MRILFISILILVFNPLFSQELIFNSTPQRGIYKNFYEFKYNRPSISLDYPIFQKRKKANLLPLGTSADTLYFLEIGTEDTSCLEKVYGFCDGNFVYKSLGGGKLTRETPFSKINYLGRYSIYNNFIVGTIPGTYSTEKYLYPFVVDVIDGDNFQLTATNVDDLIKDDPELLELYQDEKNKEREAIDYIVQYCKRNFWRHIIKPLVNDSTICKLDSDSSFQVYYQRIIDFRIDTSIIDVELRKYYYGKRKLKMIGLKAKHKKGKNEDYFYKIGTWRTFYNNRNLKSVENYDFREKKNGESVFYDELGNIKGHKVYLHGDIVQ